MYDTVYCGRNTLNIRSHYVIHIISRYKIIIIKCINLFGVIWGGWF